MGYPNAMLFHTAFHGGNTTRFMLLKMALDSKELAKFFDLSESQLGVATFGNGAKTESVNARSKRKRIPLVL